MTLARKQRTRHEDWLPVLAEARRRPDLVRASMRVAQAVDRLQRMVGDRPPVFSWSGGKDSQVAWLVARAAGMASNGVCVLTRGLEYPAFDRWVEDKRPSGCAVARTPQTLEWLADHPDRLFPDTAAAAARWYRDVQHRGQRRHMALTAPDGALIMGRRWADGNHCGPGGVYRDRDGFWRVSPLYDWSHEDVLNVMAAYQLPLAPCYDWPEGFRVATGPWAKRRRHPDGLAATWAIVRSIDPDVVAAAARVGIQGAAQALTPSTEVPA